MKGWKVTEKAPYDEVTCYVQADTRAKAIQRARQHEDSGCFSDLEWTELRATRAAYLDDIPLTYAALMKKMWIECATCYKRVDSGLWTNYDEDDPEYDTEYEAFAGPDGHIYCSEECWVKRGSPTTPNIEECICLYTDY